MIDIDYGKVAKKRVNARATRVTHSSKNYNSGNAGFSNKLYVYFSFAIILFTSGLLAGISYQKSKAVTRDSSVSASGMNRASHSNIGISGLPDEQRKTTPINKEGKKTTGDSPFHNKKDSSSFIEKEIDKVKTKSKTLKDVMVSDQRSYHILAKIYNTEKEAQYFGNKLSRLKLGVKIFLSRNRKKMKVYLGPIRGKMPAYKLLHIVKNIPEFKSAILYKN